MNYLAEFTHPTTWRSIFGTIIGKLGDKFYEWDGGIGFEDGDSVIVIHHRDGQQKARFLLYDIEIDPSAVSGGWFTTLWAEKKKVPDISLRHRHQPCRVRVWYDKKEHVADLSFGQDLNIAPIGDRVYLDPIGWCDTDRVELIEVLSQVPRT